MCDANLPDATLIAMEGCEHIVAPKSGIKGARPKIHANAAERKRTERARKKAQQQDNIA
jgi:hypothetical protein